MSNETEEKNIYISKNGKINIEEMSDEHLIKALNSKLRASFKYYLLSLTITPITEALKEEVLKRNLMSEVNTHTHDIIKAKEDILSQLKDLE